MAKEKVETLVCDRCGRKHRMADPTDTGEFGCVVFRSKNDARDNSKYSNTPLDLRRNTWDFWPEPHNAPEICSDCLDELYSWWTKPKGTATQEKGNGNG